MGLLSWILGQPPGDKLESYCLKCGAHSKLCNGCEKCSKCCGCKSDSPHADEHDEDYEYLDE